MSAATEANGSEAFQNLKTLRELRVSGAYEAFNVTVLVNFIPKFSASKINKNSDLPRYVCFDPKWNQSRVLLSSRKMCFNYFCPIGDVTTLKILLWGRVIIGSDKFYISEFSNGKRLEKLGFVGVKEAEG